MWDGWNVRVDYNLFCSCVPRYFPAQLVGKPGRLLNVALQVCLAIRSVVLIHLVVVFDDSLGERLHVADVRGGW